MYISFVRFVKNSAELLAVNEKDLALADLFGKPKKARTGCGTTVEECVTFILRWPKRMVLCSRSSLMPTYE